MKTCKTIKNKQQSDQQQQWQWTWQLVIENPGGVGGFPRGGTGIKTTRPCRTPSQRYTTHQHQQPLTTTMHCHNTAHNNSICCVAMAE